MRNASTIAVSVSDISTAALDVILALIGRSLWEPVQRPFWSRRRRYWLWELAGHKSSG
jgi:hypothetical protein